MQIAKSVAGFSGAEADDLRKAIGKKNRDGDGRPARALLRGRPRERHPGERDPGAVGGQRGGGRLLLQPLARRLLRADLLPHRLAQGQLPGRVHGRADLLGHVDEGQGAVLRRPVRGHGHRGAAARRQPVGPRLQGRGGQHPLRPRRRQGARLPGGRGDHPRARGGRPVHLDLGLLPARRLPGGEQEGDRVARQVRRDGLAARHAHRHDADAPERPGRGRSDAAGRAARPGLVLRPRRRAGGGVGSPTCRSPSCPTSASS